MNVCERSMVRVAYHGVDQTLVAIAQIGRQPTRGLVNGFVRPLSILELQRRKPLVFIRGIFEPIIHTIQHTIPRPQTRRSGGCYNLHGHVDVPMAGSMGCRKKIELAFSSRHSKVDFLTKSSGLNK